MKNGDKIYYLLAEPKRPRIYVSENERNAEAVEDVSRGYPIEVGTFTLANVTPTARFVQMLDTPPTKTDGKK